MPIGGDYFRAARDKAIIKAGGFWCEACLVGKPVIEQSPDLCYCQGCYDLLKAEAEMLPATKRPSWRPKPLQRQREQEKPILVSTDVVSNMSTLAGKKTEVDIIPPPVREVTEVTCEKRGPKHKALPVELINQWTGEGMGSKAIATRLKGEGIEVSYKTIQRLLSGERQLALPIDAT